MKIFIVTEGFYLDICKGYFSEQKAKEYIDERVEKSWKNHLDACSSIPGLLDTKENQDHMTRREFKILELEVE